MKNNAAFQTIYFCALVLWLAGVVSAQRNGDGFVGKWVHERYEATDEHGVVNPGEKVELEIERSAAGFAVRRTIWTVGAGLAAPRVTSATVGFSNGSLVRDEAVAGTWEPDEFPHSVSERYELSKKGNKLTLTSTFSGNARSPRSQAVKRSSQMVYVFKRADQ